MVNESFVRTLLSDEGPIAAISKLSPHYSRSLPGLEAVTENPTSQVLCRKPVLRTDGAERAVSEVSVGFRALVPGTTSNKSRS